MKNRGQALTFSKYPFGEKIHWRAEKGGTKFLLNLGPRWENDQMKSTQHKRQSWIQSLSLECECGGAQTERTTCPGLPIPAQRWRKLSPPLTQHPPHPRHSLREALPIQLQGKGVEKGFLPHAFGPVWGWDSPLHLSREPRCSRNRVCLESAAPGAPCGYFLAPQSGGEEMPNSVCWQPKCFPSLLLVSIITLIIKGWAQTCQKPTTVLHHEICPAHTIRCNLSSEISSPKKRLVHTWP